MSSTTADLLQRAEAYLEVTHKAVGRHDVIGEGLSCAGCALLGEIQGLPLAVTAPQTPGREQEIPDRAKLRQQLVDALVAWAERGLNPQHGVVRLRSTVTKNAQARVDALLPVVDAVVAAAVRRALEEAADALDESETLRDYTDDHMGDVNAATNELRRMAAAVASPAREEGMARQPDLTAADRQFLRFALDQGAEEKSLGDGFTDEDHAALEKLRILAADPEQGEEQPAVHVGNGVNAETCPACAGTNPPYPFICPCQVTP